MKLFIDTANIEEIREIASWGVLAGVTTNPTLAAKEGREFRSLLKEIAAVVKGPISAEAVSMEADGIVKEARELAKLADHIVIKVPISPEGLKATKKLKADGINVNMTLVFSVNQALLAASVGAAYVSPFVGRLDDIGHDGMALIEDIIAAYANYGIKTELICASVRHPQHVVQAALIGCDIATIPYDVFQKMTQHALTDKGIKAFLKDWEKIKNL